MVEGESVLIEYDGAADFMRAFVRELTDEGLQVDYDAPAARQERGAPDPGPLTHPDPGALTHADPGPLTHAYVVIEAWASGHPLTAEAGVAGAVLTQKKVVAAIERWRKGPLAAAARVGVKAKPRHRAD